MSHQSAQKNPTILETIYAQRAKDVELAKSTPGTTPQDLHTLLAMHLAPPLISFVDRLKANPSSSSINPSPSLMAEIKRASPSKGPIAMTTNAAQQALTYALSGASVISVLTEPTWFKGSLFDLRLARQAVDALPDRPAILRKEFILDEYQIDEARLYGADTVLLIVAMLEPERLQALYKYSLSLGMEPLVEVNNAREMSAALALGSKVIGVNNRNLHDFQVDMGTTSRLVEMVRERDVVLCALSGISGPKDVRLYKDEGVRAVLVGEALMRATDTTAFIRELLDWPQLEKQEHTPRVPWIKVSGITSAEDATAVVDAGADILGLVFDSKSQYHVTIDTAAHISRTIRASRAAHTPILASPSPSTSTPWFTTRVRHLTSTSPRPLLIGIFHNQPLADILLAVSTAQLDLVQLNGAEPSGWVQHIPVPVVRKFQLDAEGLREIARPGLHAFSLLETSGNSGWEAAKKVVNGGDGGASGWTLPLILGGGLNVENVRDAIRVVGPWAVDLNKETEGHDIASIAALVKAVKAA